MRTHIGQIGTIEKDLISYDLENNYPWNMIHCILFFTYEKR